MVEYELLACGHSSDDIKNMDLNHFFLFSQLRPLDKKRSMKERAMSIAMAFRGKG